MVGIGEMFRTPGAVACCEGVAEAKDPQYFGYGRGHSRLLCFVEARQGTKVLPIREEVRIVKSRVLAEIT